MVITELGFSQFYNFDATVYITKSTDQEKRLFRTFSFNNILVNKTKRGEFSIVIENATHRFLT